MKIQPNQTKPNQTKPNANPLGKAKKLSREELEQRMKAVKAVPIDTVIEESWIAASSPQEKAKRDAARASGVINLLKDCLLQRR